MINEHEIEYSPKELSKVLSMSINTLARDRANGNIIGKRKKCCASLLHFNKETGEQKRTRLYSDKTKYLKFNERWSIKSLLLGVI